MIVRGSQGIGHVATHVRTSLLPSISDPFVRANLSFTAMCLDLIAEDYDRAASNLVADRNELVEIFDMACSHVASNLRERLGVRLADQLGSLRVSKLTEQLDSDLLEIIDLHSLVENEEAAGHPWAADLNSKIWHFIENYAARRQYQSPI